MNGEITKERSVTPALQSFVSSKLKYRGAREAKFLRLVVLVPPAGDENNKASFLLATQAAGCYSRPSCYAFA
jgi:hypothetical protein